MRKIFERAVFLSLPLREGKGKGEIRRWFEVVTMLSFLVFAAALPLCAQGQQDQSSKRPSVVDSTPEQRRQDQADLERLQKWLDEYHAGKRDARDGYIIMFRMLQDYGTLGLSTSTACQNTLKEWRALRDAHPQFKVDRPEFHDMLMHEQREQLKKENAEAKEAEEKATTWSPADSVPVDFWTEKNRMALVYQYRVDFFRLPESAAKKVPNLNSALKTIKKLGLKPRKEMTFKHPLDRYIVRQSTPVTTPPVIWLCESFTAQYMTQTPGEEKIIGFGKKRTNQSGKYNDFCGAVSVDGKIIYQIPIRQHYPGQLLEIRTIINDKKGQRVLLILGSEILDEDGEEAVAHPSKLLFFWYPNRLKILNVKRDKQEILQILKSEGFSGWVGGIEGINL